MINSMDKVPWEHSVFRIKKVNKETQTSKSLGRTVPTILYMLLSHTTYIPIRNFKNQIPFDPKNFYHHFLM